MNVFSLCGESTIKHVAWWSIHPLLLVQSARLSRILSSSDQNANLDAASEPGRPLLSIEDASEWLKPSPHFTFTASLFMCFHKLS